MEIKEKDGNATIGELQVEVYWQHDARDFDGVRLSLENIYNSLGFSPNSTSIAAENIARSYLLADSAEDAARRGDFVEESGLYEEGYRKLKKAEVTLGYRNGVARMQIEWWKAFRHRRMISYYSIVQILYFIIVLL